MNRHEAIASALQTNVGKAIRAEMLEDYHEFFVDPIESADLEERSNQLVYGRGGSGKTLLFGTLNERIQGRFPERKVMSLYYTATDFRSSSDYGGLGASVKDKTHAYFHAFIERLSRDLFDLADRLIESDRGRGKARVALDLGETKREALASAVLSLIEAAGYGIENPTPASLTTKQERTRKESSSHSRSAKVAGSLSGSGGSLAIGASAGGGSTKSHTTSEASLASPARRFSPSRVRDLVGEIVEILGLDYIVIFIDEWATLTDCQVEFAERLKLCLFNDRRIAVKIAADRFQGRFSNSGHVRNFRGLEVDRDIFVAVDLDLPFRDPEQQSTLYTEALYRRLLYFEPSLEAHFGKPPLTNPQFFIDTVFVSRHAFEELCHGSQGLCRDFHELVQRCTKLLRGEADQRIDSNTVRRAIIGFTEQTYLRAKETIDSNTLLFRVIVPHLQASSSRYFLIESRPSLVTEVVNDLLSKRVIDSVPSSVLHPSVRGAYDCFEISYGIFLDLATAAEFTSGAAPVVGYDPAEVGRITSVNKSAYLLDLSILMESMDPDAVPRLCPHCGREFSSAEKAFQVRGICPHCYLDQDA